MKTVHLSETLVATRPPFHNRETHKALLQRESCLRVKENRVIKILGLIGEMGALKSRTNTRKRKFALYQQLSRIHHLRYIEFPQ
jgi:hypothetical protein